MTKKTKGKTPNELLEEKLKMLAEKIKILEEKHNQTTRRQKALRDGLISGDELTAIYGDPETVSDETLSDPQRMAAVQALIDSRSGKRKE